MWTISGNWGSISYCKYTASSTEEVKKAIEELNKVVNNLEEMTND